ncbi:MAG: LppX_LprAFG lipoprotein [Actinomycetota bacterium]|nr:LppX_LprAFG lipoprotein [Actinomycetota bacterium]
MRTRLFALALAAALTLTLSGCGGDDKPKAEDKTLAPRLAKAKATLDDAETVTIALATKKLPTGVTGLLSATGEGNHSPAFRGKVKVIVGSASVGADVVAVDGTVYAKTGFTPVFAPIDPASLKAPDPATLIATSGGVSDLLIKTTKLTDGGKTRDGSTVLLSIKGRLPGTIVKSLVPSADPTKSFAVAYRLTDDDVLRDATITGPFYPKADNVTYTIKISTSETPVTIKKP